MSHLATVGTYVGRLGALLGVTEVDLHIEEVTGGGAVSRYLRPANARSLVSVYIPHVGNDLPRLDLGPRLRLFSPELLAASAAVASAAPQLSQPPFKSSCSSVDVGFDFVLSDSFGRMPNSELIDDVALVIH